ncbi:hypothetical protein AYO21_11629 [Fonsecaea monophora]|uniref:3-alpha-hydroxysteroid dehydrogenase n=1 Tax=Fonsecaea monophora TaxID=254056 RepID=A0A177ERY3_9EURO|nr:hypothetical protein AYO21_11629 [Fonsecaea monophora]KAH0847495.1 3-alpha-(or 20-beta)-hydroxysteroid dehydrogenase [Fonsecaea pedrosoi]OAG34211.1 hypothetical protein AYO21_11629 [Fonsecaea monophora]
MGRLDGTVSIITGGARGMGASHVRGFVAEGGKVVIGDVLENEGQTLAVELGDSARFAKLDVTSDESWRHIIALTEREFGPVDILINNAGVVLWKPLGATSTEEFKRVVDIDLVGPFIGTREVVPSIKKTGRGGVIINVSSTAGLQGFAYTSSYVAAKWGLRGLTKANALELAQDNIRVVSVHPGAVETPMTEKVTPESYSQQPIPRMGKTDEVTSLMVYLAASATFSTGSEFVIDGGALLGPIVKVPLESE